MKGFPNQISNLPKLTAAFKLFVELLNGGQNVRDDEVYGEVLLRADLVRTGHKPVPVELYLEVQRTKKPSNRSYRTTARGLRELFRILGLIDYEASLITITPRGRRINEIEGPGLYEKDIELWRTTIRDMVHEGGDEEYSHPYLVLLRLVASKPGITRAKCALALEAKNDTEDELRRIVSIADLEESEIIAEMGITKTNWDNAKKILPSFAEQLGDVNKIRHSYYLSDAPGVKGTASAPDKERGIRRNGVRTPRSSRAVTADTIAASARSQEPDEIDIRNMVAGVDAETLTVRRARLRERVARHNDIVRRVAKELEGEGAELYEDPFDCLACFEDEGLLIEVKSLDGTELDEVDRVREALAQLLYYESFVIEPFTRGKPVLKIACFESEISERHITWLTGKDIQVIWCEDGGFTSDEKSRIALKSHFGFG